MNILMACGGSGGHIAPAIAVAERLPEHQCTFIISNKRVDDLFSQKYRQFEFIRIDAKPFYLSPGALIRFFRSQTRAFRFASKLLKERKVDLVVSFGGFTSLGFVLAAKLQRIPILLHESNQIPGKSTRVLARLATKILLPPQVTLRKFQRKIQAVEYPIRKEFVPIAKEDARRELGWPQLKKIILVIGGSNGALALNKWAEQNFQKFAHYNVDLFCIAGTSCLREQSLTYEDCTLHMLPFCDQMNLALRACDLVIARAGTGTIAECRYCKRPMILVPYPYAADNHQQANARAAANLGIATVIDQDNIDLLTHRVLEVLNDSTVLNRFQRALEVNFVSDAAESFSKIVEPLLDKKDQKRHNKRI